MNLSEYLSLVSSEFLPWMVAIIAVQVCNLISGLTKSYLLKSEKRVAVHLRAQLLKLVCYTVVNFTACAVYIAASKEYKISLWVNLICVALEAGSVLRNVLAIKGYELNIVKVLSLVVCKLLRVDDNKLNGIVSKKDET